MAGTRGATPSGALAATAASYTRGGTWRALQQAEPLLDTHTQDMLTSSHLLGERTGHPFAAGPDGEADMTVVSNPRLTCHCYVTPSAYTLRRFPE